jgi:hypothetical protein
MTPLERPTEHGGGERKVNSKKAFPTGPCIARAEQTPIPAALHGETGPQLGKYQGKPVPMRCFWRIQLKSGLFIAIAGGLWLDIGRKSTAPRDLVETARQGQSKVPGWERPRE